MPGSTSAHNGVPFGKDLGRIRAVREITFDQLYEDTRLSPHILKQLEKDGLFDHPLFNDVYLRLILPQIAGVLSVDSEQVMAAYELARDGRYTNQLAAAYLNEELVPAPQPPGNDLTETGEMENNSAPVSNAKSGKGTSAKKAALDVEKPSRWGWFPALVGLGMVLIFTGLGAHLLQKDSEASDHAHVVQSALPSISSLSGSEALVRESDGEAAAIEEHSQGGIALADSMRIDIIAAHGHLDPIRIRIDDDLRRPYWIEKSDSISFFVKDRLTIESRLQSIELLVEGRLFDIPPSEGSLTIIRNDMELFLEEHMAEVDGERADVNS